MTSHYRPLALSLVLCLAVFLLSAIAVSAQETAARPDRGRMPNGSYAVSDIENISLDNGNVNLNIPLASLPPIAGGKLSWSLNAQYNSKIWDIVRTQAIGQAFDLSQHYYVVDSVQQSDRGGWRITGQYQIEIRDAHDDFNYQSPPVADPDYTLMVNYNWYKVMMIMPDGSEHELRPLDYSPFPGNKEYLFGYYKENPFAQGTMRYYSYDGSYIFATITSSGDWTVSLPDGTKVTQASGIQRIQDTNSNKIKIFSDTNGTHYQDELTGREIRYFYDPSGNNNHGQGRVYYRTVGGTEEHIDINFDTTSVQGQLYTVNDWIPGQLSEEPCTHKALLSRSIQVVREIVLPVTEPTQPARRFTFSYNSDLTESVTSGARFTCSGSSTSYTRDASKGWGSLSKVITPSGAELQYVYSLDSAINPFGHSVLTTDEIAGETITKKTIVHDGTSDVWTYVIGENGGTQTYLADNSVVEETKYPQGTAVGTGIGGPWNGLTGLSYRSVRPFSKTERHWTNLRFSGVLSTSPGGALTFNPVVDAEYTTLTDAAGNALKMSARTMQYDFNGNLTQATDYDWFDPSLVSRDSYGIPTGVPVGATVLRVTNNSYFNAAPSDTSANVYAKRSISTGAPLILNAPQQATVGSSIVQFSYDGQVYGAAPTVGNLTTKKVWDDLDSKWITTSNTYDVYGNVATTTDGRGKVTTFTYGDATHALPTTVTVDPQNGTGSQSTNTAFDYYTGLVTSRTDVNGQVSTVDYTNQLLGTVDPFGRPGLAKAPAINIGGTNHQRRVTNTYVDSARQVIVASDLNAENDQLLKSRTTADVLGRPILSEQTEDGTNYTISVKKAYLDMGRVTLSSSAMRSTAATTDSWARATRDSAGRVIEVATFGGAAQAAWSGTSGVFTGAVTTAYDANFTTVTDQAGKVRRSMVDALGRLIRVDEPDGSGSLGTTASPAQPTSYGYDVFGNLTLVTQGSQTRTFSYDSLSRLRTTINPESGTVSYQYDDNGNVVVKTDPRGVSTHFEYDAINRLTRRWYNGSNSTASTTHNSPALPSGVGSTDETRLYYDSQSLPSGAPSFTRGSATGSMVAQLYGSGSNGDYYAYDVLGRATLKIQQIGTINYQLGASYTLSGAISALTYPSLHAINNSFDQAGRLTAFSGNLGDGSTRTYATGILYSPIGGLVKEQFGTNTSVYNKLFYNSRGQLAEIRASTSYTGPTDYDANRGAIINSYSDTCTGLCSGSSMSDNNGNLKRQDIEIPSQSTRQQQYSYDSLNRLVSASELISGTEQWKQQFTYDRWGNRTINTGVTYGIGINNQAFTVDTSNNRLGVPVGQSGAMSYDAAGNLTNDTYTGTGTRTYDGENKITSAWGGNNQAQLYAYDASGQRIKRTVDGVETWQVYGFGGELVAEYAASGVAASPTKEYGYRNGQLLVIAAVTASGGGENVTWTNVVGSTTSGNSVTKTASTAWGNAGASSTRSIASGDGYVEFKVTSLLTGMVALSHTDANQDYTSMEFALLPNSDGNLYVFESGVNRGSFGSYTTSDVFRVAVESGVVKYRKNGALVYTSTVTPTYPLLADVGLYHNGGTFSNVVISGSLTGSTTENVVLTNVVGSTPSGNSLTKTASTAWGNAGASSTRSIVSGDGYVEFKVTSLLTGMVALSHTDANQDYTSMEFALLPNSDGNLYVFESGVNRGSFGSYTTSDVFRVAVEGGVVKYRKNGSLVYTSTQTPTYPLLADVGLYHNGGTFSNLVISGNLIGANVGGLDLNWLVTDQLGTPRMVFDESGALNNMKRHDYLPFGEELFAPAGGRTAAQGYATGDGVRQHFTSKERDVETNLDFFEARYYSAIQGRFTSADPGGAGADPGDPRSWNAYAYAGGNPILFSDPDGMEYLVCGPNGNDGKCTTVSDEEFWAERRELKKTGNTYTGSGDFFETGQIKNADGDVVATYAQISIDDRVGQTIFAIRGAVDPIPKATAQFFGISLVAGTTGGVVLYALGPSTTITLGLKVVREVVPSYVRRVLNYIKNSKGSAPPGNKGGQTFMNDGRGGGQTLPETDANGGPITYREYDVHPYQPGVNRGPERIVRGSDGSAYYTKDHYMTFVKIE